MAISVRTKPVKFPDLQSVSHSSPGMADFVSEAKVLQFQNAFFHFASEKTGVLRAKQMGDVMRSPDGAQ